MFLESVSVKAAIAHICQSGLRKLLAYGLIRLAHCLKMKLFLKLNDEILSNPVSVPDEPISKQTSAPYYVKLITNCDHSVHYFLEIV